ncbi:MAG: GUN4 domain-containing protein [Okeania sp. SIO2H7]|uniref:GUN4 domain-containing protein n=1 Tax=Okeania sp. SIO2G4 TaxID=2607793 RepID=UPI0013FBC499|nr:GUN4 domain-containing protein [Okeania sp. SIO2G4]NEP38369.1 GUN4 domain-containing protein [Okeania sp. SIO2H7]
MGPSQTQEVGNYWQHMQTRLDVLGSRQKETYQNLHQMRQDWFKKKDKPEPPEPPEPGPPEPPEPLANYTHLSDLLAAEKWKEADIETTRVLLELADRQTNGWLRVKDIDVLPCPDLKQIDKLWIEYSKGQFGLSLQQQIWSQVGGQLGKFDNNIFYKFCDRVGWRKNNEWLKNEELEFTSDAPEGHLPSLFFTNPNNPGGWFGLRKDSFNHLLPRLSACLSSSFNGNTYAQRLKN